MPKGPYKRLTYSDIAHYFGIHRDTVSRFARTYDPHNKQDMIGLIVFFARAWPGRKRQRSRPPTKKP